MFLLLAYCKVLQANRRFTLTMASDVNDGVIGPK